MEVDRAVGRSVAAQSRECWKKAGNPPRISPAWPITAGTTTNARLTTTRKNTT